MERARTLAHGLLTNAGRATITSFLSAVGKQFEDWTSSYSLFWKDRMDTDKLFEVAQETAYKLLSSSQMIIAHLDDTIIRKSGRKVAGTSWKRDPLGPAFSTNFVWAQRFMQISLSIHGEEFNTQSKAIPIDFQHCPPVKKPNKNSSEQELKQYKEDKKQHNLNTKASERLKILRANIDTLGGKERDLYLSVDGSYTNQSILKNLPKKTVLIGRIRKDAKLNHSPEIEKTKGRNLVYGLAAQTPEQVRTDENIKYEEVKGWAAGKVHTFNVKVIKNLKWRKAGKDHTLQMVVIRPLGYRLKKGGKMLYRQAAYLICTDNNLSIEKLLQAYLWRWEIEVNFRDEKTILGCGQAQVRNEIAVEKVPQFVVAISAFLSLADIIANKTEQQVVIPRPKWEKDLEGNRNSINTLLNVFKLCLFQEKTGKSFSDFLINRNPNMKANNHHWTWMQALFYTRK
jgi:hypothetical protein